MIASSSYLDLTNRMLKARFNEHYLGIYKQKNDNFLYRYFKSTGRSLNAISINAVENNYDINSTSSLKDIKIHETALKWIKLL